jgi:hypothetical protein
VLKGQWKDLGVNKDFRGCECPSVYPLPEASPGFEAEYGSARASGALPTTVHKTSCGGDWWQLGTYTAGAIGKLGSFVATPGWEDLFAQRKIDQGHFYASKDNLYPTKAGGERRINWGWATVPPSSTQTLPRHITFNAPARTLQQYPIAELEALRGAAVAVTAAGPVKLPAGAAKNSEILVTFDLPKTAATLSVIIGDGKPVAPPPPPPPPGKGTTVGTFLAHTDLPGNDYNITHYAAPHTDAKVCEAACAADAKCDSWTYVVRGAPAGSGDCCLKKGVGCPHTGMSTCTSGAKKATTVNCGARPPPPPVATTTVCSVDFVPGAGNVTVSCGSTKDTVPLLPTEKTFEIRVFSDATFLEAFFQQGRAAMTVVASLSPATVLSVASPAAVNGSAWPVKGIWTTPEAVRAAPRIYGKTAEE